jgi:hypothetical protein
MSAPVNEKKPLVFYVEEEKGDDDFTFYVATDEKRTVLERLEKPPVQVDEESGEAPEIEEFSFAERIFIKNLNLTNDGVNASSEFWINLKQRDPNSSYQYLAKQLQPDAPTTIGEDELLEGILKILNKAISGESLENQPWAKKNFSADDIEFLSTLTDNEKKKRWQNRLILELAFPDLIRKTQAGRGLICSSYVGDYLSITFRKINESPGFVPKAHKNQGQRKKHLFSFSEYCEVLYREVFSRTGSTDHAHGLLVITGATKSGKSEITRGLIQLYLQRRGGDDERRCHLVTFEDPIERFFAARPAKMTYPLAAVEPPTKVDKRDYTPREKKRDADLLQDALNDALRQTPALFFVGETREKAEWKVLLDFAATGHLIVTTAHAGSLVEAMHKIFEALRVKTPADRSEIASKLLGLIHVKSGDLPLGAATNGQPAANEKSGVKPDATNVLFPALWRRSTRGIASLTSDGLASLLPHRSRRNAKGTTDGKNDDRDEPSCLGRRTLIEELFEAPGVHEHLLTLFNTDPPLEKLQTDAYKKAIEWDLEGV